MSEATRRTKEMAQVFKVDLWGPAIAKFFKEEISHRGVGIYLIEKKLIEEGIFVNPQEPEEKHHD